VSYQRDPRIGYIKILHRMSKLDMLIQCTTHIGSGVFACPGGVAEDEFNLSAMPSRNGRYLRAPRKGGAFHWVRAPPGARSIRKQNRMRASSRARSLCTPKNAVSTGPWRLMITALALLAIRHDGLTHKQNTEPLQTC
jgi:hypothetical protein